MQKRIVALCLSMFVLVAGAALAQGENASRPSPAAQAQCQFADGKTIRVECSSPRAKGRKIYGGLVPYGEVWRTGAPDFAVAYETTVNLAAFCAWAGAFDTNGFAICELALRLCRRAGPAGILSLRKCSTCNQNEHR